MTVRITTRWINEVETTDNHEAFEDADGKLYTYQLTEHGQLIVSRHEPAPDEAVNAIVGMPGHRSYVEKVYGPTGFQSATGDVYAYDHAKATQHVQFLSRVDGFETRNENPFL